MKTLLKTLLILLILGGLVAGGVYGYTRYTLSQPAQVQPVANWLLEYSPNQTYLGGSVISGDSLLLYGSQSKTLLEVFVTEGQAVKVGDPLIRYDTTKDTLELDEKLLDRQKLYDDLEDYYKEYKRYAKEDYERTIPTATPTFTPTPQPTATSRPTARPKSAQVNDGLGVVHLAARTQGDTARIEQQGGDGSEENPYRYQVLSTNGFPDPIPESLLIRNQAEANQRRRIIYATFTVKTIESNKTIGSVDICFFPPDTANPQGGASIAAFEKEWTEPRMFKDAIPIDDKYYGDGSLKKPFLYPYAEGKAVSPEFLRYYCRMASTKYYYVQLVGAKVNDLMLTLTFTSMGDYRILLNRTSVCTITFDANGGKVSPASTTVTYGDTYRKLPTLEREGYTFLGWYTRQNFSDKDKPVSEKDVVTSSHTLYAGWESPPTPTPTQAHTPNPSDTPTPTPYNPSHGGMSRQEREAYVEQLTQTIRDAELEYRQLCHDIELLLAETAQDGVVFSTFDGVVTQLNAQANLHEPLLEVRGGSGRSVIRCLLGETELDNYPLGKELTGFSYDIGENVTAQVTYVGNMPVTENYSNGGNPYSSGYIMLLEVQGDVELPLYSYVEFTSFEPLSKTGAIYLYEAFVREIDGQDYIFIVQDGYLRQVQVHTGRRTMEYIELVGSSLTPEDLIAFPYGKYVRDGAPVEVVEDLW